MPTRRPFEGFLRAGEAPGVDQAALLAHTVERSLESGSPVEVDRLAGAVDALLAALVEADRAEFGIPES